MPDPLPPRPDGGPAFPVASGTGHIPGMTLREWFAGQALAGLCASRQSWQGAKLVESSYRLADEMLRQGQGRT